MFSLSCWKIIFINISVKKTNWSVFNHHSMSSSWTQETTRRNYRCESLSCSDAQRDVGLNHSVWDSLMIGGRRVPPSTGTEPPPSCCRAASNSSPAGPPQTTEGLWATHGSEGRSCLCSLQVNPLIKTTGSGLLFSGSEPRWQMFRTTAANFVLL